MRRREIGSGGTSLDSLEAAGEIGIEGMREAPEDVGVEGESKRT